MNYVKYLECFSLSRHAIEIRLKNYPSSKLNGLVIAQEIVGELGYTENGLIWGKDLKYIFSIKNRFVFLEDN